MKDKYWSHTIDMDYSYWIHNSKPKCIWFFGSYGTSEEMDWSIKLFDFDPSVCRGSIGSLSFIGIIYSKFTVWSYLLHRDYQCLGYWCEYNIKYI